VSLETLEQEISEKTKIEYLLKQLI
jgi:hypothetical protein